MKKRIIALLTVIFVLSVSLISVAAANSKPYVIDKANLLADNDEIALGVKLENINKKYGLDIVVLTVNSIGDKTPMEFADDYYDDNGYGDNGALILVAVEEGERYVSTCGSCIGKIDVSDLGDEIGSYLDSKSYSTAFEGFADYVTEAYGFKVGKSALISLAIGFVVALIATGVMKGKLKSVRMQSGAANYQKAGSLKITDSRDIYLYRTVTSRKRPSSNNSSTHRSSSGRSHGGGSV